MENTKKLKAGEYLFREGDDAQSMYVVHKGTLSIQVRKGETPVELAKVNPNEVLGELAFFDRRARSASAVALTPVELTEIQFSALDRVYQSVPPYLQTIFSCVSQRLRKATDTIRQLSETQKGSPKDDSAHLSALLQVSVSLDAEAVMAAASAADKATKK